MAGADPRLPETGNTGGSKMMRSLFTGISGLKNFQLKMDVIADNIANVNTHAFKRSRVLFSNVLSETLKYPTTPKGTIGGQNGMQVGMGVQTGAIDNIITQGALEGTGVYNDVAIQGEGYLVAWDGDKYVYTRSGALGVDADGYLTQEITGFRIYGWMAETLADGSSVLNPNGAVSSINFLPGEKLPAKATTEMYFSSNLTNTAEERRFALENTLEYGVAPYKEKITITIDKVDELTWNFSIRDNDGNLVDLYSSPILPDNYVNSTGTIKLFEDGSIESVFVKNPTPGMDDYISILSFSANNDPLQRAVGNGRLDNFQIVAQPADPPLVNFWTFQDAFGVDHEFTVKYTKDPKTPNLWQWRVYDENNRLVDLDGFASNSPEMTEDYGTVAFDEYGKITSITIASSTVQGQQIAETEPRVHANDTDPSYGNYLEFRIPSYSIPLQMSFAPNGRTIVISEPTSRANREIQIGSPSLQFKVAGSEDYISFDAIKGAQHSTSLTVYDSAGIGHELITTFEKIDTNRWRYTTSLSMDDPIVKQYLYENPNAIAGDVATAAEREAIMENLFWDPKDGNTRSGIIVFNDMGKVDQSATRTANNTVYPFLTNPVKFSSKGVKDLSINLDLANLTQFDSAFSAAARSQDGYEMGMLESYSIDKYGVITGVYTNGHTHNMAQIALAVFNNPQGLVKLENGLYMPSANSGVAIIGPAQTGKRGIISSGNLEMSNVDLAQEFSEMIIAQRAFQANSRTITTADQMLQEVVGLKR